MAIFATDSALWICLILLLHSELWTEVIYEKVVHYSASRWKLVPIGSLCVVSY